jgi:DNA repair exonuclease SbcCD ATPase subunit
MALLGGAGDRLASCVEDLVGAQKALAAELAADASKSDKERQKADAALRKARSERDKVEHEIRECESQNAKKQALEEKNSELEAEAARARGEMDLRLDACRLLDETAASMRHKMAPSLTRFVRRLLPRLTAERYREVKVEENLEIKVFSSEKSDFLSVLELSGGANEALGLAFRLALSQTLIGARSRQTQFVFLDEPFKMMDAGRSMSTLRTLRELSPDLKQFFIIQPDFTAAEREALSSLVRTSLETDELEYSGLPLETVSSEPQPPP